MTSISDKKIIEKIRESFPVESIEFLRSDFDYLNTLYDPIRDFAKFLDDFGENRPSLRFKEENLLQSQVLFYSTLVDFDKYVSRQFGRDGDIVNFEFREGGLMHNKIGIFHEKILDVLKTYEDFNFLMDSALEDSANEGKDDNSFKVDIANEGLVLIVDGQDVVISKGSMTIQVTLLYALFQDHEVRYPMDILRKYFGEDKGGSNVKAFSVKMTNAKSQINQKFKIGAKTSQELILGSDKELYLNPKFTYPNS